MSGVPLSYRWLATLAFVAIICILSLTPGKSQHDDSVFVWVLANTPTAIQKLMHVGCYATLAAMWYWTFESLESRTLRVFLAFALSIGVGVALEWSQLQIPGRFGTITDVLLNSLGVMLGLLAAILLI